MADLNKSSEATVVIEVVGSEVAEAAATKSQDTSTSHQSEEAMPEEVVVDPSSPTKTISSTQLHK